MNTSPYPKMKFAGAVSVMCLVGFSLGAENSASLADDSDERLFVAGSGSEDMEASATGYIFRRNGNNGQGQLFNSGGLSSGISGGYGYGSPLQSIGSFGGGEFGGSGGLGQFGGGSGFNFPTKYGGIGNIGAGGIGSKEYNVESYGGNIGGFNDVGLGVGGLGYGSSGNLGLGGISQGSQLGYGISKNGIGLAGGFGNGRIQSGGFQGGLGYGGVGLGHGQYIPATGSLGGAGLGGIGGVASEASFNKGVGSDFHSGQEAAGGEKGSKGYKVAEGFDKGENGKIDEQQQSGGFSSAGGEKKGESEEEKKYAESAVAAKGENGETFSKSGGHKKGHKTSGFHNVYHKDEFKKDTSFYDSDHASGHQESYGSEDAHHNAAEGAYEKAEKSDAAHHEDNQAKKGSFTNGHQYGSAQGHDREEGGKEHYDNGIQYANQLGRKGGKEYGQSSGDFVKKIY